MDFPLKCPSKSTIDWRSLTQLTIKSLLKFLIDVRFFAARISPMIVILFRKPTVQPLGPVRMEEIKPKFRIVKNPVNDPTELRATIEVSMDNKNWDIR